MRWVILSLCLLGCGPTCKDACEKLYDPTLCAVDTIIDPSLHIEACVRRCRDHKTVGMRMDTGGPVEEFSSSYDWVDCVMEATCDELNQSYADSSGYYDHCEMIW